MQLGNLFSFRGRVGRGEYWIFAIFGIVPAILFAIDQTVGSIAFFVYALATLTTSVKRWHDRNKSAWWVLIGFVPVIGSLWSLIELGFMTGTVGPNSHGLAGSGSIKDRPALINAYAPVSKI